MYVLKQLFPSLLASTTLSGSHFSRLTYFTESGGFAFLPGDASIHGLDQWRVYLATGFDFHEIVTVLVWGRSESYTGFRLLPCHYTMKEGERGPFFPKLRVRIKDNNSSPHGKFYRFLFPFSSKFSDLNFASYVLYIYLHTVSLGYLCCHC